MRKKQLNPRSTKQYGKYRKYSPDSLLKAYEEVVSKGKSVRKVALQFGVPAQTLRDRVKGHICHDNLKNEETLFTYEQELSLVEHVEVMAQLGYGVTNSKLKDLGGELSQALGKKNSNKPLSNCWLSGFLERWDSRVRSVRPSALETNRARSSTPETINQYFDNLEKVIEENNLNYKPQFIYNLDETGLQPEHRPPNILAPLNGKAQSVTSPRSTTTTLIACANAVGNTLPPYLIFKGKRYNPELEKGSSPGTRITMSDSGWSNGEIFKDYLQNHFLPHVRRGSDDTQPILVIFDGHASHTSKQLIEWAISKRLILFVLPAHTSHILQPLDVAVFGPFKGYFYRECASFMRENIGKAVTKYDMTEIACKAYLRSMSPSNIISVFKKTGIYPVHRESVEMEKLYPSEAFRDKTPVSKVTALKSGKDAIDKYLQMKIETEPKPVKQCGCDCVCSAKYPTTSTKKPKPGGKEITEHSFLEAITLYEENKENSTPQKKKSVKGKRPVLKKQVYEVDENNTQTNKPSTSGLYNCQRDMSDDESIYDESEVCCVCKQYSPPNLDSRPYLKIVNWGYCDKCSHEVHLSFCHEKSVLRRGDTFLCPHCA